MRHNQAGWLGEHQWGGQVMCAIISNDVMQIALASFLHGRMLICALNTSQQVSW